MISLSVTPYNPSWPSAFEKEAALIKEALGSNCVTVHHIGSTSVPGLAAKPIIDILPVVKNIQVVDQATEAMKALGYEVKGEFGIAFRRYFQKGPHVRTHNVHAYQEGDPEIERYLKFRDWMCSHPQDAAAYAQLKQILAVTSPDMLHYCNGKDLFVASIDTKSGYEGYRMVQALTEREWSAVRHLRNSYFFKSQEDLFTWSFKHKDHIHFVFYKNAEIIGYAHIQLWPASRAALRIIVIDEKYRRLGFGGQFLNLCERWLTHQGINKLLTQASQAARSFYAHQGYILMPFEDPESHETNPNDIEMGKMLT